MRFAALFLLFSLLGGSAGAVTVEVDGRRLPSEPSPLLDGGRVLVPMRSVFEALGAQVAYKQGTVTADKAGRQIVLRPGQAAATVDGQPVTLEAPARLVSGTTYVPLRFVAQALGSRVEWQPAQRLVLVDSGTAAPRQAMADAKAQLKRLSVGNQGGVLKVWDPAGQQVVFYRGLDDRATAPLTPEHQRAILAAMNLQGQAESAALQLMHEYAQLPQREALAMLGVINSLAELEPETARQVRAFLVDTMRTDPQVADRRQAVLALAVGAGVEPATVDAVLAFYESSENLWETFPVQQFFEYQASRVKTLPSFGQVLSRVSAVNSLYRENILSYLH